VLQISCWIQQWKNFWNRPTFAKVIAFSGIFFHSHVYHVLHVYYDTVCGVYHAEFWSQRLHWTSHSSMLCVCTFHEVCTEPFNQCQRMLNHAVSLLYHWCQALSLLSQSCQWLSLLHQRCQAPTVQQQWRRRLVLLKHALLSFHPSCTLFQQQQILALLRLCRVCLALLLIWFKLVQIICIVCCMWWRIEIFHTVILPILHCEAKKHTKMFLSYLSQNSVNSDKI